MTAPSDNRDVPPADTPMARVLAPALRDRDLASALEPMRRLAAEHADDPTVRRGLEAVELLSDSLRAHAASAPSTKVQNTVPMIGIDRALFQLGMGNLEMAETVLREIAEGEPDNDIVARHLEAVQIVAAALRGELTRTRISGPDSDAPAAGDALPHDTWDDGTEVQGEEEDPFDTLDDLSVQRPPLVSDEFTAPDVTGRLAMPEVTGQSAMPEHRDDGDAGDGRHATVAETRTDAHARCEDRGPVAVRPVLAVGDVR